MISRILNPLHYITIAIFLAAPVSAYECPFKDSTAVTTPDRHCSKHCKRWADIQPVETLTLTTKVGDFLRNPVVRCEGGNGCGYITLGTPRQFNGGRSVSVTYKTWSISVKIVLEAEVCFR